MAQVMSSTMRSLAVKDRSVAASEIYSVRYKVVLRPAIDVFIWRTAASVPVSYLATYNTTVFLATNE